MPLGFQRDGFTQVPRVLLRHFSTLNISPGEFCVLLQLLSYYFEKGDEPKLRIQINIFMKKSITLSKMDLNSALSRDVIEAFVTTYNDVNQAHQLASAPSSVKLGKIQKLSWKVGVTISSSKCAGVNSITMIECFVLIILSICNLKYLHQILMRLTCKYHYYYEKREIIYHVIK